MMYLSKVLWLMIVVSMSVVSSARADERRPLKYYYPACPSWLYPVARAYPATCSQKTNPACAPAKPCTEFNAHCLHLEIFCEGKSVEQRYTTCLHTEPAAGFGGCPISSRRYKENINYLSPEESKELAGQVLDLKMASYAYKPGWEEAGSSKQLGFIIEDLPADSRFVVEETGRVNLYALSSGTIVALQQLERRVQEQERLILDLQKQLKSAQCK